jgi:HPt (histidine-containing phosphotransfer) domain-containing protein
VEAASAEEVSDFLAVEGLDSAVGLHRVSGNQKQYLKRLRQFVDQHPHNTDEIRDLLMQGDSAGAERVASQLRSTAEELGATGVAEATASLERVIRDVGDPAEIEVRWGEAERALADLVRDLKPRVKSRGERAATRDEPPPEFNLADWRRVANQMLPLLADADPGAADCLAANRDVFRSAFAAESFAQFEQQVRESEFSSALELLKKTARKRNVSLH